MAFTAQSLTKLVKLKVFQSSKYECGDILSDAVLHADSESGTTLLWLSIDKKLFGKNGFAKLFY